jgi:hypothetical protein
MSEIDCAHCAFWRNDRGMADEGLGDCCRHAPQAANQVASQTVLAVLLLAHVMKPDEKWPSWAPIVDVDTTSYSAAFPQTHDDDRCGEFQAKDTRE